MLIVLSTLKVLSTIGFGRTEFNVLAVFKPSFAIDSVLSKLCNANFDNLEAILLVASFFDLKDFINSPVFIPTGHFKPHKPVAAQVSMPKLR
ncbi:hypothetical protein [uncultured Shewanella sp.]|uniref:hypothetical protein n=1 Tax=uncultured Shewanella sp. TaxID=173975 RepID=UPI002604D766|nr:hypothetical protein [uncultured Shewanella sp.]